MFQFDEMHQTGLMWAVKRNFILMTRFLLKAFSRVNFKDLTGKTAFGFAVEFGNEEMVKILLCFKADPGSKNNKGESISDIYEKTRNKKTNLLIGQHMQLAKDILAKQKLIAVKWMFVKKAKVLLVSFSPID